MQSLLIASRRMNEVSPVGLATTLITMVLKLAGQKRPVMPFDYLNSLVLMRIANHRTQTVRY